VLVAVSANAQKGSRDGPPHLLSVPTTGAAAAVVAKTEARVIARYGAFTLVEAVGGDAERLRQAGADLRDDMREVKLGATEIDPVRERAPLATGEHAAGTRGLAVVQFAGPIKDAWLARLRSTGVRVVTYMAENGYLVHGSADQLAAVSALARSDPAFRAVVDYTAADKLGAGVRHDGRQRLAVQTLSGADGSAARGRVAELGRELRDTSAVGPFRTQYVELGGAEAAALAERPGIVSILPAPEPELYDERADQIVAGALTGADPLVPSGPGYLAYHEGLGLGTSTFPFVVDVTDEGIDQGTTSTDLADFHADGQIGSPSRIAYVDDYTLDPDARDCGGHGTINASIVGGFNGGTGAAVEDAQSFNYGLGVAPRVQLGGSKIFRCGTGEFSLAGSFTGLAGSSYDKGARIANNSWGTDVAGAYDADSQEYDAIVRDAQPGTAGNQELVEVVAAGNAGPLTSTIGSPATAKNVIAVGASEGVRASGTDGCGFTNTRADDAHDIAPFSSRGPTSDARFKPELVAPGTHITGSQSHADGYDGSGVCNKAFPAGSTLYALSTGTSHSTPVVSGMAALFREWFRQKKGGGTATPSPALTRAALVNASTDLVGGVGTGGNVPNSNQGWGLGSLARLLDTGSRSFLDQETTFGASGDAVSRTFGVQDPSKPVRVTLAWTDPPGPTSGNSFVNNLDLAVATSSGTFKGNVFSGGVSVAGGTADPRNNLESVYLPGGASGSFTVTVTAANIAGDGVPGNADATDQDFALVVSNAGPPAPGQPSGLVATPGADSVALDWSDVPTATGYELFRRIAGGEYPSSPAATPASSNFVDAGLTPGEQYCYVVRAINEVTPGPLSAEACATVPGAGGEPIGTTPGGPTGAVPTGVGVLPSLNLSSVRRVVRVGPRGWFSLRFGATPGQAGAIKLTTVRAFAAAIRRRLVIARRSFTAPASGRVAVRLKLTRRGLRVLKRARRLAVSMRVTLGPASAKRRLTLRAPRPRLRR
jgi:Subtilase family